jgi:quercetin dioxygenase-like cupin family protein
MRHDRLERMIKGWFVGPFLPTAYSTRACEVAVKRYAKGEKEAAHFHKFGTEITLVLEGEVQMMSRVWKLGDIITLEPGEITDFVALTDAVTVVVKVPGVINDKHFVC